jgi:Methane oxygenase PmoA
MKPIYLLMMAAALSSAQVKVVQEADRIRVEVDSKPFTDFILRGGEAMKPYLHPLRSASGKIVTRHFPMETVAGEPTDHPHQRGLWFAHDSVNGFDFWNNEANYTTPIRGRIAVDKITSVKSGAKAGSIGATLSWIDPHGVKLLDQSLQMTFHSDPTLRIIDFDITLTTVTKVTFGDSKDGTFGLRIAPVLQEAASAGHGSNSSLPHTGVITNAEGMEHEKAVWGKPSNWMDYSGEIEGEKLGIAIFDHPENSRRARWHVRAYGLFAANPFGLGTFTGDKSQNGSVTLEPGGMLRFRYRVVIHPGDAKSAGLTKLWEQYLK